MNPDEQKKQDADDVHRPGPAMTKRSCLRSNPVMRPSLHRKMVLVDPVTGETKTGPCEPVCEICGREAYCMHWRPADAIEIEKWLEEE